MNVIRARFRPSKERLQEISRKCAELLENLDMSDPETYIYVEEKAGLEDNEVVSDRD